MFDIGFWEMLVIGVMALLILGPERLPGAIRSTISTIRSIKNVANGFKQEVANQLDTHELHENLKKAESLGMKNIGKDLQNSVNELKAAAASVQQPYKTNKTESKKTPKTAKEKPLSAVDKPSSPEEEIPSPLLTSSEDHKAKVRKPNNE